MKGFYLVQAVLRSRFGISRAGHRIVVGTDPVSAARACFDDLDRSQRTPGVKYPEYFRVWAMETPEDFDREVGPLTIQDEPDEDTKSALHQIADLFVCVPVEVRL